MARRVFRNVLIFTVKSFNFAPSSRFLAKTFVLISCIVHDVTKHSSCHMIEHYVQKPLTEGLILTNIRAMTFYATLSSINFPTSCMKTLTHGQNFHSIAALCCFLEIGFYNKEAINDTTTL